MIESLEIKKLQIVPDIVGEQPLNEQNISQEVQKGKADTINTRLDVERTDNYD